MKKYPFLLRTLLFVTAPTIALAQTSYEQTAKDFANKIGCNSQLTLLAQDMSSRLESFESTECTIDVLKSENRVFAFSLIHSAVPPQDGRRVLVSGPTEAKLIANEWLMRIGVEAPQECEIDKSEPGYGLDTFAVVYRDRPFGFAPLAGNRTEVDVNIYSGRVVRYLHKAGYAYDPPHVVLTAENAIQRLVQRARQVYDIQIEEAQCIGLGYSADFDRPGELADANPPRLDLQKRCRLGYQVEGTGHAEGRKLHFGAFVDAETGRVLIGGMSKGGSMQKPTDPKAVRLSGDQLKVPGELPIPPTIEPIGPVWLGPASLGGIAVMLGAVWILKRRSY